MSNTGPILAPQINTNQTKRRSKNQLIFYTIFSTIVEWISAPLCEPTGGPTNQLLASRIASAHLLAPKTAPSGTKLPKWSPRPPKMDPLGSENGTQNSPRTQKWSQTTFKKQAKRLGIAREPPDSNQSRKSIEQSNNQSFFQLTNELINQTIEQSSSQANKQSNNRAMKQSSNQAGDIQLIQARWRNRPKGCWIQRTKKAFGGIRRRSKKAMDR